MSTIQIILVVIVAFIVGCSSVNDQIETYQPVVACSLIRSFQTRGPLILLQQLIGAGQCKGTAPSGRIMGDILHPDRSIVKYFRIFCDQLS